MAGGMFSTASGLEQPQFPEPLDLRLFGIYAFGAGVILAMALAELSRRLRGSRWTRFAIIGWPVYAWMGINNAIEAHIYTSVRRAHDCRDHAVCVFVRGRRGRVAVRRPGTSGVIFR